MMGAVDLYAGIPVSDFAAALAWYERLLGEPPSFVASDTEVVWELAEHRSLAVERRPDRAGRSMVTVFVDDFAERVAGIEARGIKPDKQETYGNGVRHATFTDPDGNEISFGGAPVTSSPRIRAVSWGRISVDGLGELKDAKLFPGGGRAWDWNETGTRHSPGVQAADVTELLDHGAEVVVLSRGMELRLEVGREPLDLLESNGVEVHVAETTEAVSIYNELAKTRRVGGLFHSTC